MYIIFAIVAFGLLILVHELGHFIAAKINGVKVEEFAIGMGPQIFSVAIGETDYSLRALPIGGFVQMYGESTDDDEVSTRDKRALSNKSPLVRIIVFAAGAFMNLLLALIIFTIVVMNFGFKTNVVSSVVDNSPAAVAGLKSGDKLIKIDGNRILTGDDLIMGIALAKGNPVEIEFESNGKIETKSIKPIEEDGVYRVGIYSEHIKNPSIIDSFKNSFKELISMVKQTFISLKMMFTGNIDFKTDVGGPVTIIRMAGEAAKVGVWNLVNLTAFLSVQLAVFNLLPFPALDGGHIFILLIETITRNKIPAKYVNAINTVGFALLMILMAVVLLKDIIFPVKL